MSYTVLARRFRSQTLDELIGQEAITTTIRNAISHGRVHHGYLFCGTRGVGKTSLARILAKCLNCLGSDQPTLEPCGRCDSCVGIAGGEDIDVIEIDAASNTGVDNIRELRSNANYRPARARYKVYIIDEVHMLSGQAFNALLKTLEEPPEHVKFIMATTEVQKVPATILSRVQRFEFKLIAAAQIAEQLERICKTDDVPAEEAALRRLSRLASGSMRDALSLLDQALSMGGGRLTEAVMNEIYPSTYDEEIAALIDCLAAQDAAEALKKADACLSHGQGLEHWCTTLISQLRDLMVLRVCGPDTDLVDAPSNIRPRLAEQAARFDAGALVFMITVLEDLRRNVKSSGSGRALIDAALVRLAEAPHFASLQSLLEQLDVTPEQPPSRPAARSSAGRVEPQAGPRRAPPERAAPPAPAKPADRPAAPSSTLFQDVRPTQADLRAAAAQPMVQAAVDILGGRIVQVQRINPSDAGRASTDA